jgi:hypothetical protein
MLCFDLQYSPSSMSQKSKMCGQTCARPAQACANGVSETAVRMEPNGMCTPAQPAHSAQYVQTGQAAQFGQQARFLRSLSKLRRGCIPKIKIYEPLVYIAARPSVLLSTYACLVLIYSERLRIK